MTTPGSARLQAVDLAIQEAVAYASPKSIKEAKAIASFLRWRTRERTDIPKGNVLVWMRKAPEGKQRKLAALRQLYALLRKQLPPEAKELPTVKPSDVADLVRPMVEGIVQRDWREVALRELGHRVFLLNHETTLQAMEAEISTTWIDEAVRVLWLYFKDYGFSPRGLKLVMDGVSAGTFAHVRPSAQRQTDPYCNVTIHEAAHLLHYLKPENFGLTVRRGQERFVDVRFDCRELFAYICEAYSQALKIEGRKARLDFSARMRKDGVSFPKQGRGQIADLLMAAVRSRNGWGVIREAVVERRNRRPHIPLPGPAHETVLSLS